MSTETKPAQTPTEGTPATPKKGSAAGGLLRILIPAVLAAGAAYGGSRAAAARTPAPAAAPEASHHAQSKPPGPTLPLDPFLVTIFDASKKPHPMKMSIAVEFDPHTTVDLETFVPRIRDAVLMYLRTLTFEQVTDPTHVEKVRAELIERCRSAGASGAEKILVTDFVVQ